MSTSKLIDYLEDRAGDFHRGTVRYTDDTIGVLHLREDIKEHRLEGEIKRMLERLRPESAQAEERAFPFGNLHATARVFDDAVILHFPTDEDCGVVVSLEPETARDLNTFIGECTARIHGPQ